MGIVIFIIKFLIVLEELVTVLMSKFFSMMFVIELLGKVIM